MSNSTGDQSFSHVKHLREIRDRIGKELEHMTAEEAHRWHLSQEYKNPTLRRLMSKAKPPKPPCPEHETAHALGLVPYPKYRPSGVEWLGEVPEHWQVRRLKYLVSINDDVLLENTDPELTIQYVDIGNVDHRRGVHSFESITFGTAPSRARRIVRHGDTIVSTVRTYLRAIAPIRKPASNMIVSTGFAVLRPRSASFSSGFAYHVLNAPGFVEDVVARSVGANYPAISANQIGSIPVAAPSLSEQRAIARYLDRETAKIDALITRNEVLIERLREQRAALVSRTVTHGLPPDESRKAGIDSNPKLKPSGVEWLGDVPEHWRIERIKNLFDKMERPVRECDDVVTCFRDGTVTLRKNRREAGFTESIKEIGYQGIRSGDLVVHTMDAFAGAVGVSDSDGKATPVYSVCRPQARANASFYAYLIREMARRGWIQALTRGIRERSSDFRYRELGAQWVPVPPLNEQEAIARFLGRMIGKLSKAASLAHRQIDLLHEYRTRLISDVVTGKVDVRCPAGADVEAVE